MQRLSVEEPYVGACIPLTWEDPHPTTYSNGVFPLIFSLTLTVTPRATWVQDNTESQAVEASQDDHTPLPCPSMQHLVTGCRLGHRDDKGTHAGFEGAQNVYGARSYEH